jgi:hypothetical protein
MMHCSAGPVNRIVRVFGTHVPAIPTVGVVRRKNRVRSPMHAWDAETGPLSFERVWQRACGALRRSRNFGIVGESEEVRQ